MLEKKITPKLLKIMRDDPRFGSCLVEVKVSKSHTLPATALKEHQRHALEIATKGAMYFKIPDGGWQNPCDAFIMKKEVSYLVIYYEKTHEAWAIPFDAIPEKSIHVDYARGCGVKVI